MDCSLRVKQELLPQVEFRYIWVFFINGSWTEKETDKRNGTPLVYSGEEKVELKCESVNLPVNPHSNPHPWSQSLGRNDV